MYLKALHNLSLVVTACSNEAEAMCGEQCFHSVFDQVAPPAGCSVQHLPEGTAIMSLV